MPWLTYLIASKVLFIDEVHMLDIECFSFLNRALEGDLAPIVIMASNRGMARIRGTKFRSPHGLPVDLLDRVLIISTRPYEPEDITQIIQIRYVLGMLRLTIPVEPTSPYRCQEEDVKLSDEALRVLTAMATESTLRYSLNLISCADILAKKRKSDTVDVEDLSRCYSYFLDEKRSVQWLKDQQGTMIFDEEVDDSRMVVD